MPHHTPPSSSASPAAARVLARSIPRGRSWHNNVDDRLTRKLMMLRLRRLHPVLAGTKCASNGSAVALPSLVQRLEWMLYNAAHSMHEYTHEQSLERRVQALVTQLEPKVVTEHQTTTNSRKRDRDVGISSCSDPEERRRRSLRDRSVFMLENDDNLVGLVLSFLSGRTVLQLRSVNRFLSEKAPKMQAHEPRGELLLRDITRAFELGACPELQELDLGSPLDYFAESDDVLKCLEAFATGRVPTQRGAVGDAGLLKYLRLDSTYLGDARLSRLAGVFEEAADRSRSCVNCFGSLKTLVLRNNFIGEAGCQALLRMLQSLPALRVLDVSGNILTDLDALALADWISCRAGAFKTPGNLIARSGGSCEDESPVVQLRTLLLQDNFIGQEGLEALSSALNARLIPS
ncbi:hypothetical protein PF010_g9444 [Phytophthora fragariae]|uniref:F-box domain-containing protein n=1 Tax=Phytophthora fragariae TaxID=53985 RepID=A0A6A4E4K0_9STRA|nr:hypothetical protein PF011_g8923 [Phytophthora fragariae]KAE9115122.1 hypothetical protein PF010_g9444 [Phytophthora fragariae]KAE9145783.1 hypothetical protein PF006_g9400 [Phytophthora fragariae]KAE9235542.1 hypothetical protein PF004_g9087 [Phytophthora fragariae]KAE9312234.1 hypothetical protein PF001_g9339 [Phytophthora fragariae]